MDYPNKVYAYWYAVNTAAAQAKISKLRALLSVINAKLRYNIGPAFHSVFELSTVSTETWPNYLVDIPLRTVLCDVNPKEYRKIIGDKLIFWRHCQKNQLATIKIFNRNEELAELSEADFIAAVPESCDAFFIKLAAGSGGEGAFTASKIDGLWHFQSKTGSLADLYQYCSANRENKYGWLIQPKLSSHPLISTISAPGGLSTMRILSHRRGNSVEMAFGVIKLVRAGNIIDNFKQGRAGNMVAAIDLETGMLKAAKGSLNKLWPAITSFSHCPYTGNPIEGITLPYWKETRELITRAHLSVENLPSVGWDMAITEDGPIIVEGNTNYGVDLIQVAYGRGLKPELFSQLNSLIKI
ncbi:sugar-transfer associated ATP-grasp domain-containing protein [Arsukibacterium sp.]|uniref:sugar-transfer associated ATP-grasp domain-containing protein n=1 Tax=Arsukibacterium sp. TaxID=1977258 RepID=UPI00299D7437|nr:sugar-transfer associated ATP-grasp domain-containing protein [Arsukibacterium sp.]MDX1538467.1 sugar-transfer associated ATP-grasp domain-containing protein [Arsukibacterium sp.]